MQAHISIIFLLFSSLFLSRSEKNGPFLKSGVNIHAKHKHISFTWMCANMVRVDAELKMEIFTLWKLPAATTEHAKEE